MPHLEFAPPAQPGAGRAWAAAGLVHALLFMALGLATAWKTQPQTVQAEAELWSATSYKTLREEAVVTERWNRLHPTETPRVPRVTQLLSQSSGPIVAVTDFVRSVPEQIGRYVGARTFTPLGTDGMGRSDTREALRDHFEVDMPHVVVTVLHELALSGQISKSVVAEAITHYGIQTETLGALYA